MKKEGITVTIPIEVYDRFKKIEDAFDKKKIFIDIRKELKELTFCSYSKNRLYFFYAGKTKKVIIDFIKEINDKSQEIEDLNNKIWELENENENLKKRIFVFNPFAGF